MKELKELKQPCGSAARPMVDHSTLKRRKSVVSD